MPEKRKRIRRAGRVAAEGVEFAATSLIAAIPVAGPVIAGAITDLELHHFSLRLQRFEEQLQDLASRLDSAHLDAAFIATVEYTDIAIVAIESARRTSNSAKLKVIASMLLGAATVDRPPALDVEGLLHAVSDLSPAALQLLYLLATDADPIDGSEAPADYPDVDFHLSWLIARGLIEVVHAPRPAVAARPGRSNFMPTETYRRLEDLMRAGGWRPSV